MTQEEYDALFTLQRGVCVLCKKPETYIQHGTLARLSVSQDPISKTIHLLCHDCVSQSTSKEVIANNLFVLEQLGRLQHVAWLAASSQNQVADARQLLEMIANGRLSDITTIRLSARGFFVKHPSSAD
jgi:uncharacterized membrane protein